MNPLQRSRRIAKKCGQNQPATGDRKLHGTSYCHHPRTQRHALSPRGLASLERKPSGISRCCFGTMDRLMEQRRRRGSGFRRFVVRQAIRSPLHLCFARMVEESRTEFCARMDADDVSLPQRFKSQIEYLKSHADTVAVGGQLELMDAKEVVICRRFSPLLLHGHPGDDALSQSAAQRGNHVPARGGVRLEITGNASRSRIWVCGCAWRFRVKWST